MQGKKQYNESLFIHFQLSEHIPADNFYRRLKQVVDFSFLRQKTKKYYGKEGQKSIDPVVFIKLILVGYLENLNSDRRIINVAKMRMDILYFLDYNINEALPWHSTLSRTRQLYEQDVFSAIFKSVLKQCIDKGMVSGRRQAVDGFFVKANASIDSLVEREILDDADAYTAELESNTDEAVEAAAKANAPGKAATKQKVPFTTETGGGTPVAGNDEASPLQTVTDEYARNHRREKALAAAAAKTKTAPEQKAPFTTEAGGGNPVPGSDEASPLEAVTDEYAKAYDKLAGQTKTGNKIYYNPFDPDAKMSVKPGKAPALNYLGQVSVDTGSQVITGVQAFTADRTDGNCLPEMLETLIGNLGGNGLIIDEMLADTGFSTGVALKALEDNKIKGYIPNRPQFISDRPGFTYNEEGDFYTCPNNKQLTYRGTYAGPDSADKYYRVSRKICNVCPFKDTCAVYATKKKAITDTVDRDYYLRMHQRMQTERGKWMKKKRQSTVEPAIGMLVNFLGIKRVNTKGLEQANKCLTMAAAAYNLKKLLKTVPKPRIITIEQSLKEGQMTLPKAFYSLLAAHWSMHRPIITQLQLLAQKFK